MKMQQLTPTQVLQEKGRKLIRRNSLRTLLVSACSTVVCTFLLFGVVFGLACVQGDSMNPTLKHNDFVLFCRVDGFGAGDVVILRAEGITLRRLVKRIVGVPGDTVNIDTWGTVSVNGKVLQESYAIGTTQQKENEKFPLTLGTNEYFVLGDNRENSSDSRNFGTIKKDQINGRALALFRARIKAAPSS